MTRKQKSKRANDRRKFFNSNKSHCIYCGSLYVSIRNLTGDLLVEQACPLYACPGASL